MYIMYPYAFMVNKDISICVCVYVCAFVQVCVCVCVSIIQQDVKLSDQSLFDELYANHFRVTDFI